MTQTNNSGVLNDEIDELFSDWLNWITLEREEICDITQEEWNALKQAINDYIKQREIELLQRLLDTQLPWPKDIFGEVPKDDWPKINEFNKREFGYSTDRIGGELMRRGWKCYKYVIKERLIELQREENG